MSLNQLKNAQVQSSLGVGGGSGAGVTSLNAQSGAVSLTSTNGTVLISPSAGSINLSVSSSGAGITGLSGSASGSVTTTSAVPIITGAGAISVTSSTTGLTISGTALAGNSRFKQALVTSSTHVASGGGAGTSSAPWFSIACGLTSGALYSVALSLDTAGWTVGTGLSGVNFTLQPFVSATSAGTPSPPVNQTFFVDPTNGYLPQSPVLANWTSATATIPPCNVLYNNFLATDGNVYVNLQVAGGSGSTFPSAINWSATKVNYWISVTPLSALPF